jgi:hypothetical protein
VHANLKMRHQADHIAADIKLPVADLLQLPEYEKAYKAACAAQEPMKGERPDRDPQVRTGALLT